LCIAAAACLGPAAAQAAPPLPQRNLSVEMRISDDSSAARRDASAGASVTIGSTGRVDAAGAATVRSSSQQQGLGTVQRVLVLNGGRASLRLACTTCCQAASRRQRWRCGSAMRSSNTAQTASTMPAKIFSITTGSAPQARLRSLRSATDSIAKSTGLASASSASSRQALCNSC